MKTYRRHGCTAKHRTYNTLARCAWPRAVWVHGEGEYALLARCRVLTVSLWDDLSAAEQRKAFIDRYACGGGCHQAHEIVRLALP